MQIAKPSETSLPLRLALIATTLLSAACAEWDDADLVTRTTVVEGELQITVEDDFESGTAEYRFWLETETGPVELDPTGLLDKGLGSGSYVRVEGLEGDRGLTVKALQPLSWLAPSQQTLALQSGERSVVVIVVDFADEPVGCSDQKIAADMFTGTRNINDLYLASSYGALSFPPDTDGDGSPDVIRVTISAAVADATCEYTRWGDLAEVEAQNLGVDLSLYQHRLFMLPDAAPCGFAGVAYVGCGAFSGGCEAYSRRCTLPDVAAHELGHNIGMGHAATDPENDGVVNCSYCDTSDFMGFGGVGWRQNNAPHRDQMGWLTSQQLAVYNGGAATFTLRALGDDAGASERRAVKIARGDLGDYYLSYRNNVGYDVNMSSDARFRTSLHARKPGSRESMLVATLGDGEVFHEAALDLTITQVSNDGIRATVSITPGVAGCASDADCDDGAFCNGAEVCNAGACAAGQAPCASELCDEVADTCAAPPECASDADCSDGIFCNGAEVCDAGTCTPGSDPCPGTICDDNVDVCGCLSDAECSDGLFCNGAEVCSAGVCEAGADPCAGASCNESDDVCVVLTSCGDGVCGDGESCGSCPQDCVEVASGCNANGICEPGLGEDCLSCASDCAGKQDGKPSARFCCGDGEGSNAVGCGDARCSSGGAQCDSGISAPSCCGDGVCGGTEDSSFCEVDCGPPPSCGDGVCHAEEDQCGCPSDCGAAPSTEGSCIDGFDGDCDGAVDCADSDCDADPACQISICAASGDSCTADADCCTNKCKGGPGNSRCH